MAKTKVLTPEQMQRRAVRKQREIARREKQRAKPKRRAYLLYMVFLICLIYITDEIASQICVQMKTEIAGDLFAKFGDSSLGKLELLTLVSYAFMGVSLFYKPLSDRFGRRLFLVVNTFGMSLGMLMIFLSRSILAYTVGFCVISFFIPHDMQVVYIMETAPAKHRAKIYALVKCVATLGVMVVPLLRRLLMENASQWRLVFLVPAVVGLAVSFVALLLARETDAFIDSRLRYLHMSEEELAAEKARKDMQNAQGGFFASLRFSLRHKQLRWLLIYMAFVNLAFVISMQYQVMMSYGYAQNMVTATGVTLDTALGAVSTGAVTEALFLFPVGSALFQLMVGFISDKFGRKPASALMCGVTIVTLLLFTFGARLAWPPALVGFFAGACIGSFWAVGDINVMMLSESAPTNLRSSVPSSGYVIEALGTVVSMAILLPLMNVVGNAVVTPVVLAVSVPGLVIGLVL
ncbi:MAG: MFS transporter, partial [Clostridia bacterium]|nr:MFS transporter [Clostridia bacterium]